MREKIAKKIYDWGYENLYFKGSNKVWNFVDDVEPEKDGARDLAIELLSLLIEEIKKVENPYPLDNLESEIFELCREKILNKMEGK
jgi:hypothetical protein